MHKKWISEIDTLILKEINPAVKSIERIGGKHLRPLLYLETCKTVGKKPDIKTAAAIEMIHQASLYHDDVIDETDKRRGNNTFRKQTSNKESILTGDYLYLKAVDILGKEAIDVCKKMIMGELLQRNRSKEVLKIAELKTAELFGLSMKLAGGKAYGEIGKTAGLVFQLNDDLKDKEEDHAGQVITYPILHGKEKAEKKRDELQKKVRSLLTKTKVNADLEKIINRIIMP